MRPDGDPGLPAPNEMRAQLEEHRRGRDRTEHTQPIPIRFEVDLLRRLRLMAARKRVGYQTLLKMFVAERLYEEEKREGLLPATVSLPERVAQLIATAPDRVEVNLYLDPTEMFGSRQQAAPRTTSRAGGAHGRLSSRSLPAVLSNVRSQLARMDRHELAAWLHGNLAGRGWTSEQAPTREPDSGIDGVLRDQSGALSVFEVKTGLSRVSAGDVHVVAAQMRSYGGDRMILVTDADISAEVEAAAREESVEIWRVSDLAMLAVSSAVVALDAGGAVPPLVRQ
jgi:hypothetical protein